MVEWFTIVQLVIAVLAGTLCVVWGMWGRSPNDLTMGATALVELFLIAQCVVALVSPAFGNHPSGDVLEFYTYLFSALLLPFAAGFWALLDRTRWSTVILAVACFSVAIMLYRMNQIWFSVLSLPGSV